MTRILSVAGALVALLPAPSDRAPVACVAIFDAAANHTWRSDEAGCRARLAPASTFKIPHALVALHTGAIRPATVEHWDGTKFPDQAVWERDHTLESAIRHSVVWFFQRTAARIGPALMRTYLERLHYGNADTSGDPIRYWLNGRLRVSADEQLAFLERFFAADGALPFERRDIVFVRQALIQEPGTIRNARGAHRMSASWSTPTEVRAKTGATTADDGDGVSWLVGEVRKGGRACVFVSVAGRPGRVDPMEAADRAFEALARRRILD